jgi:hypothetical protein
MKSLLGEIGRVLAVRRHVVDNPVKSLAVFQNQPIKRRDITRLHTPDNFHVGIRLQLPLRRRDERLRGDGFGGVHNVNRKSSVVLLVQTEFPDEPGFYWADGRNDATCVFKTSHNPNSSGVDA